MIWNVGDGIRMKFSKNTRKIEKKTRTHEGVSMYITREKRRTQLTELLEDKLSEGYIKVSSYFC